MTFHTKHNGTWKEVGSNSFYVKYNGVWTVVDEAFVKSGGLWKQYFINEIAVTLASTTNVDAEGLFDSAVWTATTPKRIIVPSGVTIGGTGGTAALTIPSNMAGPLNIDVIGDVIGTGGAANGGAGGHAILNNAGGVIVNVEAGGQLLAGGGGGGRGGQGGNGSYTNTGTLQNYSNCMKHTYYDSDGPPDVWQGIVDGAVRYTTNNFGQNNSWTYNGGTYQKTEYRFAVSGNINYYRISYSIPQTSTGGSGGAGGVGQGYLQALTTGSVGAAGGTNAGTGGSGSDGAAYGQTAATGSTGSNGNASNGSAGLAGGSAGDAVNGTSITLNNAGTVAGSVA